MTYADTARLVGTMAVNVADIRFTDVLAAGEVSLKIEFIGSRDLVPVRLRVFYAEGVDKEMVKAAMRKYLEEKD